jgi:hypothetical protein
LGCEKIAKKFSRDGWGIKHPYPGKVADVSAVSPSYGQGCVIKWYQSETVPLPIIPEGFRFVFRPNWGTYLVKIGSKWDNPTLKTAIG